MSVILRLQNLPWSANAMDIRQYFHGLNIPEGGVHIVGGEVGDAFIAFGTDEDARQAFGRNNGNIKGVKITLMLSSRSEMHRTIEEARTQPGERFLKNKPSTSLLPSAVATNSQTTMFEKEPKKSLKEEKRKKERKSRSLSRRLSRESNKSNSDRSEDRSRDRSRGRSRGRTKKRYRERSRDRSKDKVKRRSKSCFRSNSGRNRESVSIEREDRKTGKPFEEIKCHNYLQHTKKSLSEKLDNQNKSDSPILQPPSILGNYTNFLPLDAERKKTQACDNPKSSSPPSYLLGAYPIRFNENITTFNGNGLFQSHNLSFNNDSVKFKDCCISLEPFFGGYREIRRFFQGMFIGSRGIKFVNDTNGKSTGMVYVKFANEKFKETALKMNGCFLSEKNITIKEISEKEFNKVVDRYHPRIAKDFTENFKITNVYTFSCLRVEELPSYCEKQDLRRMFSGFYILDVTLTINEKESLVAYIKFSSPEQAVQALKKVTSHVVGGKTVVVKPCKDSEFQAILENLNTSKPIDAGSECLRVSGLSEKFTSKDISNLFSDIRVAPKKIHVTNNLGQAYFEFETGEEASRAVKNSRAAFERSNITIDFIKREEMESAIKRNIPKSGITSNFGIGKVNLTKQKQVEYRFSSSQKLNGIIKPTAIQNAEEKNLIKLLDTKDTKNGHNLNQQMPINNLSINLQNNRLSITHHFLETKKPSNYLPKDRKFISMENNSQGFLSIKQSNDLFFPRQPLCSKPIPMPIPVLQNIGRSRFSSCSFDMRAEPIFESRGFGLSRCRYSPPSKDVFDYVPPGCTVFMNNLPFKAPTNDILNFFSGFKHTNCISRWCDENNYPSDEAKIIFFEPQEAARAVRELHRAKIWDRQIFLRQV